MQTVSVSVVVPVYCNVETLLELWQRLRDTLNARHPNFEVLLVDDGSSDGSWQLIEQLSMSDSRVKGIRLSRNFGQHPAIAAAFDRVLGEKIVLMDADLQDRPETIPELLALLGPAADVVYTLKTGERPSLVTRISSLIFHRSFSIISKVPIPGEIGTFRAFSRKVLAAVQAHREYNVLFGPLMLFVGFKSKYVIVQRDMRRHGTTGYTFVKRLSLATTALASYTNFPHQFFFSMGTTVLLITIIYLLVVLGQSLIYGAQLPPGLTLIALLLLFFMGITMISLGVIGSYVFRVYQEVLNRPRYLVDEEIGFAAKSKSQQNLSNEKGSSPNHV